MSRSRITLIVAGLLGVVTAGFGAEPICGWRGNGTGLWPTATPPLEWHRIPRGALDGLRGTATRPGGKEHGDAPLVAKGLLRDWLVIGPFPVADAVKDFDRDFLGGESNVEPSPGQTVGEAAWKAATVPAEDIMAFGNAELPWLDLAKLIGYKRSQLAYAHTYVYSPRGGPVHFVVNHGQGLQAWVNGKVVYRSVERRMGLGYYSAMGKIELHHIDTPSPRFEAELRPGWNRLLLKSSTANIDGYNDMRCCLRLMDPPDVKYDTKNIVWMTALPGRSTSTPIMVGDRLFVMAEPDELVCLDKQRGQILWSAAINYYEALSQAEKQAQPAFAERVDPLIAKLKQTADRSERVRVRARIQKALLDIDEPRFGIRANGHFEGHFGIVGFTMPTPVSDGKHVYVWSGMGVAACFDLDGRRQWITRVKTPDELAYGSSPVLADGVLVVFLNQLYGLDARTGKLLWQQRKVLHNQATLLGTTIAGQPVVITQLGHFIRPSTGELLFRQRDSFNADFAAPLILGSRLYAPKYGVASINIWDLAKVQPTTSEPPLAKKLELPPEISRGPGGKWVDRWTAGSPLVWDGIVYQSDIYHTLYAVDLASGKMLYRKEMDMDGLMHYNAVPMAASPTLIGKHLFFLDNQGTTFVLEPGPTYKVVARNRIATQLARPWPIPSQETLAYAPPLADGSRLYLRGEAYMYCVGEK